MTTTQFHELVVDLYSDAARDAAVTGAKAAALNRAAAAGAPTLPGAVLTTAFATDVDAGADIDDHWAVRAAFEQMDGRSRPLVARSSSVIEDAAESSMAGQFESVVDIRGFDAFREAVRKVLASRSRAGRGDDPMAVLVQPLIEPAFGGVLFGIDPVSGRTDRQVVSAVRGGPERLVSGRVEGSRYVLGPGGKVVDFTAGDGPRLARRDLRRLVALAAQVEDEFGHAQDVEWAIGTDGRLVLLQSRAITTERAGAPSGPVYGPGPIAETFPEPLTMLEQDLWVPPLQEAVREAVVLAGTIRPSDLDASGVVVVVGGRVAIDLRLAGEIAPTVSLVGRANPMPALRRLRAAWRVGRLRGALPRLAEDLLDRVDADLETVPELDRLTSRQLLALLYRSRSVLRALHAHEILMGMLTDTGHNRMTGASVALRILDEARRDGLADAEIIHRSPAVLALTAPRVAPSTALPPTAMWINLGTDRDNANDNGILREALRMRVRWLHELSGRAAWTLGERLAADGQLPSPELVRHVSLEHLQAVATQRAAIVPALVAAHGGTFGPPLPARFQLSDLGKPVRVERESKAGGGTGAGGGIGRGPVTYDFEDPPVGSVLVTTTLQPGLGPLLCRLQGIVAETGSVLSHLAILAREAHVATVVGYDGATDDLPEGAVVSVNGDTGEVSLESATAEL